ncbi:hypothetical protein CU043_02470 [Corynebacterium striatum]|nr:hypothetical protein [Corynebacterium striatum]
MTLLGSIHDSLVAVQLLTHGVKPENLPKEGIREAFIKQLIQPKEDEQVADIEPKLREKRLGRSFARVQIFAQLWGQFITNHIPGD